MKSKKGLEQIGLLVVFLIIVIVFVFGMFYVIYSKSSDSINHEELYAKKIALDIDRAKPGDKISMDINDLRKYFDENKNKYVETPFLISDGRVSVRLSSESSGYSYWFISDYEVESLVRINRDNGDYFLDILIKEKENGK